ncbi:MAG: NAD(P)H:quinone oxidoreductase [Pseudomonadota bacterium]
MHPILVVFYSQHGSTEALAREICRGVDSVSAAESWLRCVPPVSAKSEKSIAAVPEDGPPYVSRTELAQCHGLLIGSPTRFGNMSSAMKYFLDGTSGEWLSGALSGKPGGVFTSSTSMHGGQESTLLSMAIPLLHHGMLITGIPYSEPELTTTQSGGTPYGASQVAGSDQAGRLTDAERKLAFAHGRRVADIAVRLFDE